MPGCELPEHGGVPWRTDGELSVDGYNSLLFKRPLRVSSDMEQTPILDPVELSDFAPGVV